MQQAATVTWQREGMHFQGTNIHHQKADMENHGEGSKESGPTPMEYILYALAGCTGIDVISILTKMKMVPDEFSIDVSAERAETHPKVYTKIHLVYRFKGSHLVEEKVKRAIELSEGSYCSVSAMLKPKVEISYEYILK